MKSKYAVSGSVATGFEPVRAAFESNFKNNAEVGAAVNVTVDGAIMVDLWGGTADAAGARAWNADTIVNVWSTTKGWLALGYVMNRMAFGLDTRAVALCRSVYGCLGK